VINSNGGGANYFTGNSAGSTSTGGRTSSYFPAQNRGSGQGYRRAFAKM